MKKINYIILTLIIFFTFNMNTFAKTVVSITGTDVRIRSKAGTDGKKLGAANSGDEFLLLDLNAGSAGNGCTKDWYKITYGSEVGYVCSQFAVIKEIEEIKEEDYKEYKDYLKELGFPDTYIPYLLELHVKRPNWKFKVMNIDLDFNYVVKEEHKSSGRSLIEDTNRTIDGYKSLASWSYNYLTDVFSTNFIGGGSEWYAASEKTIAYYIDPRNFLSENKIFMFESQSYNEAYHTKEGIEKMLKGTFMENAIADKTNNKTYVDAFLDAAVKHKISPYVLISRVIQEVGAKGSTIISGTVKGYEGYYNFYNIGAYGDSDKSTIENGLIKAKEEGWDNQYKAVVGGAKFMSDSYLEQGQDTLYLNKWDLIGPTYFNHQYMQNIEAPNHESVKTYKGYQNIGLLNNEFVFSIPVFKNMPEKTSLPNKGNPNNYLSTLSVNGTYLFKAADNKTDYKMNLSTSTNSVEIIATKVSPKSTISGLGTISLEGTNQNIKVEVKAENNDIRIYNINITRTNDIPLAISEILNISNIKNDGTYIYVKELGKDISETINKIKEKEPKATVTVTDYENKVKTKGLIATGDKIKIKTTEEEKELTVLIYGDINSDGEINKIDAAAILRHYYKYTSYDGIYKLAADVSKDGNIDKVDVAAVLRHLYGYAKIEQ